MDKFGLIGEKLGHSYSPMIHNRLAGYAYELLELAPEELEDFLQNTELTGLNVTIPYKKAVIPLCASLSDAAGRIGSVNTLVRENGLWRGYNTDYDGFLYMLDSCGCDPRGKKALIFGDGGVSPTVKTALLDRGAGSVTVISRKGENNYDRLGLHRDARILVNATPVGMFPHNGEKLLTLKSFPDCECVLDLIYNPARTALLLEAESLGIPCRNGLGMLVYQAKRASELFTGKAIDEGLAERTLRELEKLTLNLVLIGMPGSGKSSIGRALAKRLGRSFYDADEELERAAGKRIPDIFASEGEAAFRALETKTLEKLGKMSGCVIATGGGCVTVSENYALLHQNGKLIWIKRANAALPTEGRPLSQENTVYALYEKRKERYAAFADTEIANERDIEHAVQKITEMI